MFYTGRYAPSSLYWFAVFQLNWGNDQLRCFRLSRSNFPNVGGEEKCNGCSLLVIIFLIAAASPVWAVSLDYELVAESSQLQLYINPETAETAVVEVADGTVWYSNPTQHAIEKKLWLAVLQRTL